MLNKRIGSGTSRMKEGKKLDDNNRDSQSEAANRKGTFGYTEMFQEGSFTDSNSSKEREKASNPVRVFYSARAGQESLRIS